MAEKILVIHLSRLGDMIQSLPAIKLFKEDLPDSSISYLGIEGFCHILKDLPWIDKLVTLPWDEVATILGEPNEAKIEGLDRLLHVTPELQGQYDLLVNLTHNWTSTYLCEKIKAKEKRGRVFSKSNEVVVSGKWAKYLFAMAKNREDNILNLVDIYMGILGIRNRPVGQFLCTDYEVDQKCTSFLSHRGLKAGKLSIGFQLGASKLDRMWPLEYFVELGEFLSRHLDAQIVLFGSERDMALADQFQEIATYSFINLIGSTTLTELGSFFKSLDVLVSNDTGPMHIAAAVGTKVVGLFLGTAYFGITAPYGAGHVAIQSNYPCAPCLNATACSNPLCRESIEPDTVAQAIKLSLGLQDRVSQMGAGSSVYESSFNTDGTMRYRLISQSTDSFLPWLRSLHYLKASVSQTLWNNWLCLASDFDSELGKSNGNLRDILSGFQEACLAHKEICEDGKALCQKIIREFKKKRPNFELIQLMVESLWQVGERVKDLEGPIPILKEMHEYYIAETEVCRFPRLAYQFLEKYMLISDIVTDLQATLQRIDSDI